MTKRQNAQTSPFEFYREKEGGRDLATRKLRRGKVRYMEKKNHAVNRRVSSRDSAKKRRGVSSSSYRRKKREGSRSAKIKEEGRLSARSDRRKEGRGLVTVTENIISIDPSAAGVCRQRKEKKGEQTVAGRLRQLRLQTKEKAKWG